MNLNLEGILDPEIWIVVAKVSLHSVSIDEYLLISLVVVGGDYLRE